MTTLTCVPCFLFSKEKSKEEGGEEGKEEGKEDSKEQVTLSSTEAIAANRCDVALTLSEPDLGVIISIRIVYGTLWPLNL